MRQVCIVVAVVLAVLGSAVLVADVKCPIDRSSSYFTGKTKTDSATGRLLWEYHCARDHYFWIVK